VKWLPTSTNLKEFYVDLGIRPEDISHKKMKELILLDDWPSVFSEILPALKRGAYSAVDWAHKKYVQPDLEEAQLKEELELAEKQRELDKIR